MGATVLELTRILSIIMHIATPYGLPFRAMVQEPPLLRGGTTVIVTADFDGPITDQAVDVFNGFMDAFWGLGVAGALAGDSVEPWKSTVVDKSDPQTGSGTVRWVLEGCELDERAVVILVHMFLAASESSKIGEISINKSYGAGRVQLLAEDPGLDDPYPPRWPEARFNIDIEPLVTDSRRVWIEFKRAPTPQEVLEVQTNLLGWSVAAAVGAYAVAPLSPMSTYIEPDTQVEVYGVELTWYLHKIRVHPAAIDGLVNVCIGVDRTIAPISALRID